MMPDPLDAAFAALGNNQALRARSRLDKFERAARRARRACACWSTRTATSSGTRTSTTCGSARCARCRRRPSAAIRGSRACPQVAGTEAWGRRMLNTQLGSWAELRHDTILYAKQSYTGGPAASSPTPTSSRTRRSSRRSRSTPEQGARSSSSPPAPSRRAAPSAIAGYFDRSRRSRRTLADMAERERRGEPFTPSSWPSSTTPCAWSGRLRLHHDRRPGRLVRRPVLRAARSRSSSTRRSPTCTRSRPTKPATPSARCCTWAPAIRG